MAGNYYDQAARQRFAGMTTAINNMPSEPPNLDRTRGAANLLRLVGGLAPLAGSAIGAGLGFATGSAAGGVGALPGMMAGAQLGNIAGQGVGNIAGYGADSMMQPYDENAIRRQARMQGIMSALGAMRPGGGGF